MQNSNDAAKQGFDMPLTEWQVDDVQVVEIRRERTREDRSPQNENYEEQELCHGMGGLSHLDRLPDGAGKFRERQQCFWFGTVVREQARISVNRQE